MTRTPLPADAGAPETVVIRRARSATAEDRAAFVHRVARILPHLNWRAHLYLLPAEPVDACGGARELTEAVCAYLAAHSFAAMVVHPFVRISAKETLGASDWSAILAPARPFREEAYRLQGEPRLMISPVLDCGTAPAAHLWQRHATLLREASSHPSVILTAAPDDDARSATEPPRFYLAEDAGTDARIAMLGAAHVVEGGLARLQGENATLIAPCRPHLLIDEASNMVYACFQRWNSGRALCSLGDWQRRVAHGDGVPGDVETCAACLGRSLLAEDDALRANRRESEARRLHFELALAFAERDAYRAAATHAARAAVLSDTEHERGSALLHEGLCHLSLGELEAAETALARAAELAEDPGIIAYHRGRNQLEWRDYIEALDRFGEALASGSPAIPAKELRFQMALCHVRLEEYADARPHIAAWREAGGETASIRFYEALCDLGEGHTEAALGGFRDALDAGPLESDRSRVLFYIGHCLKELDREEEAIEPLLRATDLDPGDLAICNLLGFCYYKTARHREAVACFRRAIEIDPTSGIDHANLASNLRDLGRTDEAIAAYEKALQLDPTITFARDNLAALRGRKA